MDEKKNLALFFILSLPVSMVFLTVSLFSIEKLYDSFFYQILLIIGLINLFICLFSLKKFHVEIKYDINNRKKMEKTIRDFYRYKIMMDPPDIDT